MIPRKRDTQHTKDVADTIKTVIEILTEIKNENRLDDDVIIDDDDDDIIDVDDYDDDDDEDNLEVVDEDDVEDDVEDEDDTIIEINDDLKETVEINESVINDGRTWNGLKQTKPIEESYNLYKTAQSFL